MKLPKARFQFGQKVRVNWKEAGVPASAAWIVGVNCNPRRSLKVSYSIIEGDSDSDWLIDEIDEDMIQKI